MDTRLFPLVFVSALVAQTPLVHAIPFTDMYVFGDSLSDNGNLYGYTGAPGSVTGGVPIPVSPPYFPGTFQNGPSYAELLWSGLQSAGLLQTTGDLTPRGLLPGLPPGLDPNAPAGTNYAVGGARSRYHVFDVGSGLAPVGQPPGSATFYPFSLLGQLEQFTADFGGSADPDALYVVWSGSNDLGDALQLGLALGPGAARIRLQEAIADVGTVLAGLVAGGAENLLVPNLPDLGLIPAVNRNPLAASVATDLSATYNSALGMVLEMLRLASPDLNVHTFDTFAFVRELASAPQDFGFTNVSDPCLQGLFVAPSPGAPPPSVCDNPDEYVFWDIIHPTARTHAILAAEMQAAVPEPATILLIGLGLAALGLRRRA
jgi:phospholipase/lecithinase/hemolysin